MIFLSYDFICFFLTFIAIYVLTGRWPQARVALLIISGLWFQLFYGGARSLLVALTLALVAYTAGRTKSRPVIIVAITVCVATLVFYKYSLFLAHSILEPFLSTAFEATINSAAPATILPRHQFLRF